MNIFKFKRNINDIYTQIWEKSTSNYALEESNTQIYKVECR